MTRKLNSLAEKTGLEGGGRVNNFSMLTVSAATTQLKLCTAFSNIQLLHRIITAGHVLS